MIDPVLASNAGTLISAVIVLPALYQAFRPTAVDARRAWGRTAVVSALALALALLSLRLAPHQAWLLGGYAAAGLAAGTVAGILSARSVRYLRDAPAGRLVMQGSAATAAIWIAVIVLRPALRYAFLPGIPIAGLDFNVASLVVVAAAFAVLAWTAQRAASDQPARTA